MDVVVEHRQVLLHEKARNRDGDEVARFGAVSELRCGHDGAIVIVLYEPIVKELHEVPKSQ